MNPLVRHAATAAVLSLSLALAGCAGLANFDWTGKKRQLSDTQLRYVHFLRWGEYEAASTLVEPDLREAFLEEVEGLSNVRLSDYQVLDTVWDETEDTATITVSFSAYNLSRLIEHRWREKQVWSRDPKSRGWMVKPDIEQMRLALAEMKPQH